MKNFLFTLVLLSAGSIALNAQSTPEFKFHPDTVRLHPLPTSPDSAADADIISLINSDIVIKWQRYQYFMTQGCATKVCDLNACYGENTSTKQFTLPAGDTALISVHFVNNTGAHGQGLVRLDMWNIDIPDVIVPVYYLFNITESTGTNEGVRVPEVKVFPNPVAESFSVQQENISRIRMMDMDGRELTAWTAPGGGRFSIAGYAPGMYVLIMEDDRGQAVGVAQLQKK